MSDPACACCARHWEGDPCTCGHPRTRYIFGGLACDCGDGGRHRPDCMAPMYCSACRRLMGMASFPNGGTVCGECIGARAENP